MWSSGLRGPSHELMPFCLRRLQDRIAAAEGRAALAEAAASDEVAAAEAAAARAQQRAAGAEARAQQLQVDLDAERAAAAAAAREAQRLQVNCCWIDVPRLYLRVRSSDLHLRGSAARSSGGCCLLNQSICAGHLCWLIRLA